jgi:phosphatidylserine decarboxylase
MVKLTGYGTDVIVGALLAAVLLLVAGLFVDLIPVKVLLIALAIFLAAFTIYFFRDPERTIPSAAADGRTIISPADGKVVVIQQAVDKEYVGGPVQQISIFLSPLNVHVNRHPISGDIDYVKYIKGKFVAAFHDKASEVNEQSHIGINNGRHRILMKQITGAIARRIVYDVKVGDKATIGERFGMIKFGSRTDLLLPVGSEIDVKVGDIVVGGITVIGRLPAA